MMAIGNGGGAERKWCCLAIWIMSTNAQFHMASGVFYTITFATLSTARELETCFEVVFTTPTVCMLACLFVCCLSNELSVCLQCCFLSAISPECLLGSVCFNKHLCHLRNFILYLYLLSFSVLYFSS